MMKFVVDTEFWTVFPEAQINVLTIKNINNHSSEDNHRYFSDLLNCASKEATKFLTEDIFSQNQVIDEIV